jgi:2-polyprenyl-3-methyl-5-hydroxy-6-metoxy-1,4-benzoquinol methylase
MSLTDAYAKYLQRIQTPLWKNLLDVQAPYRWNLRRLKPGRTLDVGCGIGRNLVHLMGEGVGVDPNPACVVEARARGCEAFVPDELPAGLFDSVLIAHVLEHLQEPEALVARYVPRLRPGGQLILITPQELGFACDETHVQFLDLADLRRIAENAGLTVERAYSFPLPRWAGALFRYNEFVLTARAEAG